MSGTMKADLNGVAETLLIPLLVRAEETYRPDALLRDERAAALVSQIDYDFTRIRQIRMDDDDRTVLILRNREFDRKVTDFIERRPEPVIVQLGCGLDGRFERVNDGRLTWYDLDLPQVIDLRRRLMDGESERRHYLPFSAFDPAWMEIAGVHRPRPFLFLAEGVFPYFTEAQIRTLILALQNAFPESELVFDGASPFLVWANNLRMKMTRLSARYYWSLKNARTLEKWSPGIRLLEEWFPLNRPEPRLEHLRWMRRIPLFARIMGIYHYRLGTR